MSENQACLFSADVIMACRDLSHTMQPNYLSSEKKSPDENSVRVCDGLKPKPCHVFLLTT